MIVIRNLSKAYGSNEVLKNISASFEAGTVYGIVGTNGAGKTTLFRCIAGLESAGGEVTASKSPLKNHLGFLPAELYFFPRLKGAEYLRLFCNARNQPVRNLDEQNIFDLPLDQYAATYSTGMQKKLALLAVLLQGNEYFILDEPFNGVDIQSNLLITEIILHLKALGKTVLLSSHIFATLRDTCDAIYLLEEGQLSPPFQPRDFDQLEGRLKASLINTPIQRLGLR